LQEVLTNERNAQATLQQAQQKLLELRNGTRFEEIAQDRARVAQARAQLQAVQVQEEDTVIRAPFTGIVTQKYANVGAFVTPTTSASATTSATSTSIVAIASFLEVLAKVPETSVGQIKPKARVQIVADAFPGNKFQGQVRLIAPEAVVEQNVTSFQVRVALKSGQSQLRSGMNVDLTFLGDNLKNALVVPTVAIVTQKGQHGVLIPDAQLNPQFHPVTIGFTADEQTQVIEGLRPSEPVFVYLPQVPNKEGKNGHL
jgi:HlyD family secretion protein